MNNLFSDMAWRAAGRLKDMFISSIFWVYILFYIIVDRRSSNISLPTVSNDVKEEKIKRDEVHILVEHNIDTIDVSSSTSSLPSETVILVDEQVSEELEDKGKKNRNKRLGEIFMWVCVYCGLAWWWAVFIYGSIHLLS